MSKKRNLFLRIEFKLHNERHTKEVLEKEFQERQSKFEGLKNENYQLDREHTQKKNFSTKDEVVKERQTEKDKTKKRLETFNQQITDVDTNIVSPYE
jgi:uncharacterized protein (DUF3084 family)